MTRRTLVRLTPLRRHLAAVLTIALSCAFVAVMLLAGSLVQASLRAEAAQLYDGADLEITRSLTEEDWSSQGPLPTPQVDGAESVWPEPSSYLQLSGPESDAFARVVMQVPGEAPELIAGAPAADGTEVVLDSTAADALEVEVGDSVSLPADFSHDGAERSFTVVGIVPAPQGAVFGATPRLLVSSVNTEQILGPQAGTLTTTWFATVPDGASPAEIAEIAARADGADGLSVRTAEAAIQQSSEEMLRGFAALGLVLAVFVVIALFTSAVVIANTFAVTIAQRTRSLALLRTLGATRAQVRAVVLRESLVVGLLGAVLGMLGGHLLAQLALAGAAGVGWLDGVMAVPVSLLSLVVPVLAGVVITLLACLAPMRAATRVAPLQALRPVPPSRHRGLGVRGLLGLLAVAIGILALAGGTYLALDGSASLGILAAMAGGVVSFSGVLLVLVVVTRPLSALVAHAVGRIGGLPARIAGANVARNPRRSAATIAALLIGTTLMTMMAVGARTAETTLTSELDSRRPIDLVVSAGTVPQDAAEQIAAIPGMDAAGASERGDIDVGAEIPMTLYSVTPALLREISHRPGMADELRDGIVLLGQERAGEFGIVDDQVLELPGPDGQVHELRVRVDANLQMSLVTPATLAQLVPEGTRPVILADFADPGSAGRAGIDLHEIVTAVDEVTTQDGFSEVNLVAGGAEREAYGQILAILLGITIGLLAVAVLVALVGVASTLSLGVIERTGENALLRALGTTRRQMRRMLGWEGILLALVGAVLGIALGSLYGVLGINALLGSTFPVTITIPWGQLAAVLILAVLAGALASVMPGRAAARTAPAAALAGGE